MAGQTADAHSVQGHLIVVDDDQLFRESLIGNLEDSGFRVSGFADGHAALDYLKNGGQPQIVLLDWKMPELSGIEVLRQLRASDIDLPVIFLTVLSDQIYEEAALLGGAVDFVEKSRSFSILLKRIELALSGLRRRDAHGQNGGGAVIEQGPLELRVDTNRASWGGTQIDLTLTEFRFVKLLAGQAGQDIGYRQLYDLVHGENFAAGDGEIGYRSNVRAIIKRIRQKFRKIDPEFDQIENYPGFGYKWRDE